MAIFDEDEYDEADFYGLDDSCDDEEEAQKEKRS